MSPSSIIHPRRISILPAHLLRMPLVGCAALGLLLATSGAIAWSNEPDPQNQNTQPERGEQGQSQQQQAQQDQTHDEHAEDEAPALGVVVGSCPGEGVCVMDTVYGSPADEAGIQEGDYIVSINDQQVSTPGELKQVIEKLQPGKKVAVTLWRRGEEQKKEITLASKADQAPPGHRAWLGVMLVPAEEQGVRIDQVMGNSPAAKAGLRRGDVIIRQGDTKVTDVEAFIESVEDLGPGSEMKLTIQRNGSEKEVTAKLGRIDNAPMQFLRQAMRPMMGRWQMGMRPDDGSGSDPMLDETLDEMQRRLNALEQQVRELRGQAEGDRANQQPEADAAGAEGDLTKRSDVLASGEHQLVVQRDGRRASRDWDRYRDRYRSYRYGYPNRYNNPYRWGYGSPLFRSPMYGNQYYRYRGQPYYYGGGRGFRYGYGRSGIRIGDFGVYWY